MNPEERVDFLLRQRRIDPAMLSDHEADLLDAAAAVQDLTAVRIPPVFATQLEARVRERARQLQSSDQPVSSDAPRRTTPVSPSLRQRIFIATGGVVGVVLVGILLFVVSLNSLPGDWLYGLKQYSNQLVLSQSHSPTARAQVAIQQLHGALSDLRAEVSAGRADGDIVQAIKVVQSTTHTAQTAVTAIPAGAASTQAQHDLAAALADEQTTLRSLLAHTHVPVRVALTKQLSAIGVSVVTIEVVTVIVAGNDQEIIEIKGAYFLQGAQVVLDNHTVSTVQAFSPDHIVMRLPASALIDGMHTVSVLNPDGTAATATFTANSSHGHSGNHPTPVPPNGQHTPIPAGTPGNGSSNGHRGTPTPGAKSAIRG